MIKVIHAGSFGIEVNEDQFLERIAGLCLALYLNNYGFQGRRLEINIFNGTKRKLRRYLRRIRKRGCWVYAIQKGRQMFLLFTDSPGIFRALHMIEIEHVSALEVLKTAIGRHKRQSAVKTAVRMLAF